MRPDLRLTSGTPRRQSAASTKPSPSSARSMCWFIRPADRCPASLLEVTPEQWMRAFDVHVHAAFYLCRAVIPWMQKKKEGAIMLVSSSAGKVRLSGQHRLPDRQRRLPQMARAMARDFANDNIRINVVAPGVIRTAFHATMPEHPQK